VRQQDELQEERACCALAAPDWDFQNVGNAVKTHLDNVPSAIPHIMPFLIELGKLRKDCIAEHPSSKLPPPNPKLDLLLSEAVMRRLNTVLGSLPPIVLCIAAQGNLTHPFVPDTKIISCRSMEESADRSLPKPDSYCLRVTVTVPLFLEFPQRSRGVHARASSTVAFGGSCPLMKRRRCDLV
jgi:hypothetical protein